MPPRVTGILETCLYVEDVDRSRAFYERLFAFVPLVTEKRICVLDVAPAQVLILFERGGTLEPVPVGDSFIPSHDAGGRQHFAFAIAADDYEPWKRHLAGNGIAVESEIAWRSGGKSLYFRDLDGHLVELATPGVWANY
jgi:catechol 2,3-dioxygenase-like lactoylglutathione lyase family enzyme